MKKKKYKEISLLQLWREGLGLTRQQIADKLKINDTLWGRYETRRCIPNGRTVIKIRDFFINYDIAGVSADSILDNLLGGK